MQSIFFAHVIWHRANQWRGNVDRLVGWPVGGKKGSKPGQYKLLVQRDVSRQFVSGIVRKQSHAWPIKQRQLI